MGRLVLVLGGQKAGKSTAATRLAERSGHPLRLVTPATPQDAELHERIERHRRDRPAALPVHETHDVAEVLAAHPDDAIVVDALDTWLGQRMLDEGLFDVGDEPTALGADGQAAQERVLADVDGLATAALERRGPTWVIAGTVGMGMHGPTPASRRYEDLHGLATQRLAGHADRSLLVVAGRAIDLDDLDVLRQDTP